MDNPAFKFKTILIVDDDPVQVKLMEGTLKAKGFEVTTTTDASDGLQKAMSVPPDLIILDVMMPIINGFNFCKLLKSDAKYKNIAIILATSRDETDDIKIGLEMGADAYLTKPINLEELLKTIKVVESSGRSS